jgi:predicted secreted protein
MTTGAISTFGVVLTRATYAIAEITKISALGEKLDTIDVTNHDSANKYREFIGGLLEAGEVSIEGNYLSSDTNGQMGLRTDMRARTLQAFVMTFPGSITETCTFSALVTEYHPGDFNIDGALKFTAKLKISGMPVWAVSQSADISAMTYVDSVGAKTSLPTFVATTHDYSLTIATASDWVKITATHATAASITAVCRGVTHQLVTTVQSSAIYVDVAGTTTDIVVTATVTGQVPVVYTIHVVRP